MKDEFEFTATHLEPKGVYNGSLFVQWQDEEYQYRAAFDLESTMPNTAERITRSPRHDAPRHMWGAKFRTLDPKKSINRRRLHEVRKLAIEQGFFEQARQQRAQRKREQASQKDQAEKAILLAQNTRKMLSTLRRVDRAFAVAEGAHQMTLTFGMQQVLREVRETIQPLSHIELKDDDVCATCNQPGCRNPLHRTLRLEPNS